jgi:hypothetical protein
MLAVVALVAAMSPITAAHAASPVNVRVINAEAVSIDLWQDGVQIVTNLARGAGIDVASTGGGHQYIVCTAGSQATPVVGVSCNDGPPSTLPLAAGPIDFVSGSNNTFVVGPGGNGIGFTNSLSRTVAGNYRFSLNNATLAIPLNVCFNGVQMLTNILPGPPGGSSAPGSEVEGAAGQPVNVQIGTAANCIGAPSILLDLAAGTNTVITVPALPPGVCTTGCAQILLVDQVAPQNVPVQSAFCTALLSLQGIQAQIKATFGAVKAGDPATSPSKFQVKSLVDTINAAVKSGDTHVTNLQKGYWDTATQGLEDLAAGLTAAGFDWNKIPTDKQQLIIDGANGVNQAPNQDLDTAKEGLTAFAVANCLSASTVKGSGPTFTG